VRFAASIDVYVADMRAQGRIASDYTERSYRSILRRHCEDVGNRDPRYTDRNDVKRTLRRWGKPNTQRTGRAILISFYDWLMEEGLRRDNPARQTRRPKAQATSVYRLTREEAAAFLAAARTPRERRVAFLGVCAGLRNRELRLLQGRHLQRPGFVWVSKDIAKGGRERWVPIIADLAPIIEEIRAAVEPDHYVLPAQRWRDPGVNHVRGDLRTRPSSSQALRTLVMDLAKRAGIKAHVHPHLMRHAFGDHVARHAGIKIAQALLGHATVQTTEIYTGAPSLDELAAAVSGFGFLPTQTPTERSSETATRVPVGASSASPARLTEEAPTGIEPVLSAGRAAVENFSFDSDELRAKVALYARHFQMLAGAA
jgi:site-specific recombinase XerD